MFTLANKQYSIGDTLKIDEVHRYRVLEIKEGGMALVLICDRESDCADFDLIHRKHIAIKTFKSPNAPLDVALFEHELKIWINLESASIVPLLKVLREKGNLLAIMPHYPSNLRTKLNSSKVFSVSQSAQILLDIISGLHYAYNRHGVVHQDIKPENILVHESNPSVETHYLISDWGISNLQSYYYPTEPEGFHGRGSIYKTLSRMGTLPYMSPERLLGAPTSLEADIYALGIMFFEMLVGFLPFRPSRDVEMAEEILVGNCLLTIHTLLSKSFDDRVVRAISKCVNPAIINRYHDYHNLSKDLKKIARLK